GIHQPDSFLFSTCGDANPSNVVQNVIDGFGREGENLWHAPQPGKYRSEIIGRGRANVAELLSDDQIGLNLLQLFPIESIQALATGSETVHLAVDLWLGEPMRKLADDDYRF